MSEERLRDEQSAWNEISCVVSEWPASTTWYTHENILYAKTETTFVTCCQHVCGIYMSSASVTGVGRIFPGWAGIFKFNFTRSKQREQPFYAKNLIRKCQILKPSSPLPLSDTAHSCRLICGGRFTRPIFNFFYSCTPSHLSFLH